MTLLAAAPAAAVTYTGPAFPPPGGVNFTTNGILAIDPGRIVTYQNFDLSATDELYFGITSSGLAMDGSLNPGEMLSFDAANSDLSNGVARFIGTTQLTSFSVPQTVYTRLTLTFADLAGTTPLALTINPDIGGGLFPVLNVQSGFTIAQAFTASDSLAGTYTSAGSYYFNKPGTPNIVQPVRSSISGGFYYTLAAAGAVPEPATWAFMIVGFGAVGYSLRSARKHKLSAATA